MGQTPETPPKWGDAPASAVHLGQIANWIYEEAPADWRWIADPQATTADVAITMLRAGVSAWRQLGEIRRAVRDSDCFTETELEGDLPSLIRRLANTPVDHGLRREPGRVDDRERS